MRWRSESKALSEHIAPRTPWMSEPWFLASRGKRPDERKFNLMYGNRQLRNINQTDERGRGCGQIETAEGAFPEGRVDFTFTT